MGCGCSSGSNINHSVVIGSPNFSTGVQTINNEPCDITKDNLIKWQSILQCLKSLEKYNLVGLAEFSTNQLLGVIQSAINYPENYCLYKQQLDYFKNSILITIIENVPECV